MVRYFSLLFSVLALLGCAESSAPSDQAVIELTLQCDKNQERCSGTYQSTDYELVLSNPSLPALEPLNFVFSASQAEPQNSDQQQSIKISEAWFEGRDMFMGEHKLSFEHSSAGSMLEGIIPVCVTGAEMVWRLNIVFEQGGDSLRAHADLSSLAAHQ